MVVRTDAAVRTARYAAAGRTCSSSRRASTTHIADVLVEGAIAEFDARGVTYERITVPGALEIPQVLAAAAAARAAGRTAFDGAIALGCVIRGETAHYDIVCNNANHWLDGVGRCATMCPSATPF